MKKIISFFTIIVLLVSTGCGNKQSLNKHEIEKEENKTEVNSSQQGKKDDNNNNNSDSYKYKIDNSTEIKVTFAKKIEDGKMHALVQGFDKDNKLLWKYKTDNYDIPDADPVSIYYVNDSNEKMAIVNSNGTLVALDITNGKKLWKNDQFGSGGVYNYSSKHKRLVGAAWYQPYLLVVDITNGKTLYRVENDYGLNTKEYELMSVYSILNVDDTNYILDVEQNSDNEMVIDFNIENYKLKVRKDK